jgi:hypothetical protein
LSSFFQAFLALSLSLASPFSRNYLLPRGKLAARDWGVTRIKQASHAVGPRFVDCVVTVATRSWADMSDGTRGGRIMGVLMIQCPKTGREVSTGIEMLDVEQLPAVTATTVCPACGRIHAWSKKDAWLADGGEQYRVLAAH